MSSCHSESFIPIGPSLLWEELHYTGRQMTRPPADPLYTEESLAFDN